MTPKEALITAKALIDTPEKWIQGAVEDIHGRYCALGAADVACGGVADELVIDALWRALPKSFPLWDEDKFYRRDRIGRYNDTHTHRGVMSLYNRAIEAAE